jgi:hypothetical protein
VPVTPWCAGVFESWKILENGKPPSRVRASDMHHILLVLLFLLHDLVRPEVEEYNRLNPAEEPLVDPSSGCIDVTLLLLTLYRLFRRCDPPKDEEDINELQELADRYLNLSENIKIYLNLSKFPWSFSLRLALFLPFTSRNAQKSFPMKIC